MSGRQKHWTDEGEAVSVDANLNWTSALWNSRSRPI